MCVCVHARHLANTTNKPGYKCNFTFVICLLHMTLRTDTTTKTKTKTNKNIKDMMIFDFEKIK